MNTGISKAVVALMLTALAACSGVNREAAASLATSGQVASTSVLEFTQQTSRNLVMNADRSAAIKILVAAPTTIDAQMLADFAGTNAQTRLDLAAIIDKRATMLKKLESAYAGYLALAQVDAEAETAKAVTDLGESTNALIAAIPNSPLQALKIAPIDKAIFDIAGSTLGLIASERQKVLLENTNSALLKALTVTLEILEQEKAVIISLDDENEILKRNFAKAMHDRKLIASNPYQQNLDLETANQLAALVAEQAPKTTLPNSPSATQKKALLAYRTYKENASEKGAAHEYDQRLAALATLVESHKALQKRPNMTSQEAISLAEKLGALVRQIQDYNKSN